jgi:hypothetical protein
MQKTRDQKKKKTNTEKLLLQKFDKDQDGELGLEDMQALMRKLQKK